MTPLSHRIARPLAEGLRNRVVCRDGEAARLMPQRLLGVHEAIRAALRQVDQHEVETAWSDAGPIPGDPDWAGGTVFVDRRQIEVSASPSVVFRAISRLSMAAWTRIPTAGVTRRSGVAGSPSSTAGSA